MKEYPSNSHRSKEENDILPEKKTEKVVTGNAVVRKKTGINKLADIFLAEDLANVKSYLVEDVIVPAVRDFLWEFISNGAQTIIYGKGSAKPGAKKSPASKVSYRSYYENPNDRREPKQETRVHSVYDYDNIEFDDRGDAEAVLARMKEHIYEYDAVSVADFYDFADITGNYTDNKYGWYDLSTIRGATRVRGGKYVLKLPKIVPLD